MRRTIARRDLPVALRRSLPDPGRDFVPSDGSAELLSRRLTSSRRSLKIDAFSTTDGPSASAETKRGQPLGREVRTNLNRNAAGPRVFVVAALATVVLASNGTATAATDAKWTGRRTVARASHHCKCAAACRGSSCCCAKADPEPAPPPRKTQPATRGAVSDGPCLAARPCGGGEGLPGPASPAPTGKTAACSALIPRTSEPGRPHQADHRDSLLPALVADLLDDPPERGAYAPTDRGA